MHALRYLPPHASDNALRHIMGMIHDPYAIGFRLVAPEQKEPPFPCRHSAIYAVSLHPGLGIAQFTNPEGLTLPLILQDCQRSAFEREMSRAYERKLGQLRGAGQFAVRLEDFGSGQALLRRSHGGKALLGRWSGFVTYYLSPPAGSVRWLQDGPASDDPQSVAEWREIFDEREAVREWLLGPQPDDSAWVTHHG